MARREGVVIKQRCRHVGMHRITTDGRGALSWFVDSSRRTRYSWLRFLREVHPAVFAALFLPLCASTAWGTPVTIKRHTPLRITTTALPSGIVGDPYRASLAANGGITPYRWILTGGRLPSGLSLNEATGVLSGTPAAVADAVRLAFTVTDSRTPVQKRTITVHFTVAASTDNVSVSPNLAAVTVRQGLAVTATTSDGAAVSWSAGGSGCGGRRCGTFSSVTSASGGSVTWTAPGRAGTYTIAATSLSDNAASGSVTVAVTDMAGVLTYHNHLSRDGANTQEYALSPSTVSVATFGKLFSCPVDGAVYAQPLWAPDLKIGSVRHNVIFVATENDSVYAFDADSSSCTLLWDANLLDPAHGGTAGETSVPSGITDYLVGNNQPDIAPEIGVTGTPVIDPVTRTLYVVSKSVVPSGPTFYQRLHALDLFTGKEKFSGPVNITATYPGTGDGGTTTTFDARSENQRAALVLFRGVVYIAWGAHEDTPPYYGWVIGYTANNLSQVSVFNDTPNAGYGGIWMSGGAPAVDAAGNLYMITGNGAFDATSASAPQNDYGDSFLKLSLGLKVAQYFTPSDQASDQANDGDFGSGGAVILANLPPNGSNPRHLVFGGGKDGALYVLDGDNLGGFGDSNAWQKIDLGLPILATGAFWNSTFYIAPRNGTLEALSLSSATARLSSVIQQTPTVFPFPGATPSVSSMPDNTNGIVWALDNSQYCTFRSPGCGPAVLHAYDAENLHRELWNSTQGTGNSAGNAVKFTVPTVANGKVYVGTRGNNTGGLDSSSSIPGELDVYGLLPH